MGRFDGPIRTLSRGQISKFGRRISAALFGLALILLILTLAATRLHNIDLSSVLLGIALATFCAVVFYFSRSLLLLQQQQQETANALDTTETSLRESEERFRQMADNIQEVFWMIDAQTKETLYVNPAYETITGRSRTSLKADPRSYEEIIHPEERIDVLFKLAEATQTGDFNERFRIVLPNGRLRWVWVRGFPVRDEKGRIRRLVGTGFDITNQKQAEEEVVRSLRVAESAWAEADAMRRSTLALTQNLCMDSVLDTLLQCLFELVPYESAQILLLESGSRVFLARSAPPSSGAEKQPAPFPMTLDTACSPLLQKALASQNGILLSASELDQYSSTFNGFPRSRSWLCVPLIASARLIGLLALGHSAAEQFTPEHLRLARSVAIPAAAAIQNARLYECAKIYGVELEKRTTDLQEAQSALQRFQNRNPS